MLNPSFISPLFRSYNEEGKSKAEETEAEESEADKAEFPLQPPLQWTEVPVRYKRWQVAAIVKAMRNLATALWEIDPTHAIQYLI